VSLLAGKKLLITGVLTPESIAFAVAQVCQEEGAEILLTSFGRAVKITERTARRLPGEAPDVLELDANDPSHVERVAGELRSRWGRLDGFLHAIAFAPEDALGGAFLETPWESAHTAFQTSAFSLKTLSAGFAPLMAEGGAVVSMDFDAAVAWPIYDWMGVSKAALESITRYLARYLGPQGIRVNCVSAGPLRTMAAKSIPGFATLASSWERRAPLTWNIHDPEPVAKAVAFLLSDWSKGITGEILHVDGGYHAIGAELEISPDDAGGNAR
jgi:meromycolic acid enoyl-[acyl-carrier-protein] reductase